MNFHELASTLAEASKAGTNVFLRSTPDPWDFTDSQGCVLHVHGSGGNSVDVPVTPQTVGPVLSYLKVSVLAKGNKLIAWDWKNVLSYHRAITGKDFPVEAAVIDLKVIEEYAGVKKMPPKGLPEALGRLKSLVTGGSWAESQAVYKRIHLPLVTSVGPEMETAGILSSEARKKVYAYYELVSQENGRLKCRQGYRDGFVPHTLGKEDKKDLKPRAFDELFMYFDFRAFEVHVLQYFSQDGKLGEILANGDIYTRLYEAITGVQGDELAKDKGKMIFLPVVYGQSADALAKRIKVANPVAEKIVARVYDLFPAALRWVESFQKQAKETGWAKDQYGKRRFFSPGEEYLARNFSVQAPASTISLDRLVRLHTALKGLADIAYSVHDGYCVYATKENWRRVYKTASTALTADSDLCPGLRLRVACHAGRNLDSLKPLSQTKDSA